jgi:hypothetical protein
MNSSSPLINANCKISSGQLALKIYTKNDSFLLLIAYFALNQFYLPIPLMEGGAELLWP